MKKLILFSGLIAAMLVLVVAVNAQTPNFAGTWNLDKAKSQGLSPRMQGADKVTWTITQDDKTISIDQKVEGGQPAAGNMGGGDRMGGGGGRGPAGPQSYNLDGKETTSDIAFGPNTAKLTTKATGSPTALELLRKTAFTPQDGSERVSTTTQKLTLSGDGKTLTAAVHSEGGRNAGDSTLVFTKQ